MLPSRDSCYCRFVLLFLVCFLVATDSAMAQVTPQKASDRIEKLVTTSEDPAWLSIDYTGALYGYYRIEPDDQNQNFGDLGPVQEFLKKRENKTGILLGMGDNFGPEFGASVQREFAGDADCYLKANRPWPGHANVPPEILYKMENRLPRKPDCDNVARFLIRAEYDAIVPGKEDFLYSALWLREMALLFRGKGDPAWREKPLKNPVMLAANLRLNFKVETNAAASIVDKQNLGKEMKGDFRHPICPLLFSWHPLPEVSDSLDGKASSSIGAGPDTCVSGSGNDYTVTTEMDWLRRLDATLAPDPQCAPNDGEANTCFPVAAAMNKQAQTNSIFRRQLLENESQIIFATLSKAVATESCLQKLGNALRPLGTNSAFKPLQGESSPLLLQDLNASLAGLSDCPEADRDLNMVLGELRSGLSASNSRDSGILFSPEASRAAIRLLLRKIAAEQKDIGYTFIGKTLVIGVMGPEMMRAVSPTNLRLCTFRMALDLAARTPDIHACDDPANSVLPGGNSDLFPGRLMGTVVVGDPVLAVTTLLRAAWLNRTEFEHVVVMAQMPPTEAHELAAHVLSSIKKMNYAEAWSGESKTGEKSATVQTSPETLHVDLILSEAQQEHNTPKLALDYDRDQLIPVLTPRPAWYINHEQTGLVDSVSTVTINRTGINSSKRTLDNAAPDTDRENPFAHYVPTTSKNGLRSMAELLKCELDLAPPSPDRRNLNDFWQKCGDESACKDSVMSQFLAEQIHRSSRADVALLENRDFYFGRLLGGYETPICDGLPNDNQQKRKDLPKHPQAYCRLRVALDRVLWKGDYSERVMVDGKTLKSALTLAQQESSDEQSLAARDATDEWLMTYGIVTEPPKNLSASSMGPGTFSVPGARFCKNDQSEGGTPQYCVDGRKISDDGAYWISTSDHLAQDSQLYKLFNSLDAKYHQKKKELFITGEIADEIAERDSKGTSEDFTKKKNKVADAQAGMSKLETAQQDRPITQLDYAKAVVGFMFRKPDKSNTALGADFAGVADSRATTPSAQEVDLEAVTRVTRGLGVGQFWHDVKIGIQSDLEYDRAVAGNITGNPLTVTYALNTFATGGFVQYRFLSHRFLPQSSRFFLVVAPYQYQEQITGNYLNFKFTTPPGQITVATPAARGFVQRLGARWEFGGSWTGSYAESGPEYSWTHNVLSDLILPDGTDCMVSAASFSSCFKQDNLVITSATVLKPLTRTLHTGGWYWDVHLQKPLDKAKRTSFTVETKGDHSELPGFTLPTQSHYAFTTTGALNFAVIGNFVFSPTYTTFYYRDQGTQGNPSHSLVTNTFSVTAKWYFDRDAAVPFWRQLWFQGPASLDQTKTAKMK